MATGARPAATTRTAATTRAAASARTAATTRTTLIQEGLIGYWSLGEGTGLPRFSFDGRLALNGQVGTEAQGAGIQGNCVVLNGTTQYLRLRRDLSFNFGRTTGGLVTQDFTISVWAKLAVGPTGGNISTAHSKQASAVGLRSWILCASGPTDVSTPNNWSLRLSKDGNSDTILDSGVPWVAGAWHHLLFWMDNTAQTFNLRVNGGAAALAALAAGWWVNPTVEFQLGGRNNGSSLFNGSLDELAAWNRALAVAEQDFVYGSGAPPVFPW